MSISKISYKASTSSTTPTAAEAKEMKESLQAALDQIGQAEQYDQYFTVSEKAELEKSKALITADLQAIEYFLKTGDWIGATASSSTLTGDQLFDLDSVDEGWYQYNADGELIQPDLEADPSGEYTYVMNVENNTTTDADGNLIPTKLWFVATNDMLDITGENKGNDILLTVTYKDGHKETYLIKNGAIRNDLQIGVNALKNDEGIKIDFSKTAIINPKTGEKCGVFIIGSQGTDTIYGSAGKDEINGAGGGDLIVGMAGDDDIFGYASDDVKSVYGSGNLGDDGNDTIYDVDGGDVIDAGAGSQDVVYRGITSNTVVPASNEEGMEPELTPSEMTTAELEQWFGGTTGWTYATGSNNEVVLSSNGNTDGSIVKMMAADGYMVTASREGNDDDLILTAVKIEGGKPKYYRIRIKNYFSSANDTLKLEMSGNFIDMSGVNVGIRPVSLAGTGAAGDILVAPKTIFDEYGITAEDLGVSNVDQTYVESLLEAYQTELYNTSIWSSEETGGSMTCVGGDVYIDAANFPDGFDIPATFGDAAFVQQNNGELTITVVSNTGTSSDRIVIHVRNATSGVPITLGGSSGQVKWVGSTPGVTIDGGAGEDFIVGGKYGTTVQDQSGDSGFQIKYKPLDHESGADTTLTEEEFLEDIQSATSYALLDQYQDTVEGYDDDDEMKETLQDAINDRRISLINSDIEKLDNLYSTYNSLKEDEDADTEKLEAARDALQEAIDEIREQIELLEGRDEDEIDATDITALESALDTKMNKYEIENYDVK